MSGRNVLNVCVNACLGLMLGLLQCVSWQYRMEVHIPEKQSNIHYISPAPVMTYFSQWHQRGS